MPWKRILGGIEHNSQIRLDFAGSERSFAPLCRQNGLSIDRTWDVDSFFARVHTLAVHRDGFRFAYRPPFLRRITQNPRVLFNNHRIHKLKQLRIGSGLASGGSSYECHAFFPNMPVPGSSETHLTDDEQADWVNDIVLPALKVACPNDILQHHPRSFADAAAKASANQEIHMQGAVRWLDVRYVIPEAHLATFSAELVRRANSEPLRPRFGGIFFVIQAHDLKLQTKRPTLAISHDDFVSSLHRYFHFHADNVMLEESWIDVGFEDTPSTTAGAAVTLLRKSHCNRHWADSFACPESQQKRIKPALYNWGATRDASSINVQLSSRNAMRTRIGIVYNKAYNLHKDVFATPFKGHNLFDHPQLEGLGYGTDLLQRWTDLNSKFGNRHINKRQQIIDTYLQSKARLRTALTSSVQTCFGVRQEYRMNLAYFLELATLPHADTRTSNAANLSPNNQDLEARSTAVNLNPINQDLEERLNGHAPYWILPTKVVNGFLAGQMNRWMLCLEILSARAQASPEGILASSSEAQLIDGVLISAMLRLLRLSTGSFIASSQPGLWRGLFSPRPRGRRWAIDSTEDEDEDEDEEEAEEVGRSGRKSQGLDMARSFETCGMAWLAGSMMNWGAPAFTARALRRLVIARNGLQLSHRKTRNIQAKLQRENCFFQLWDSALREARDGLARLSRGDHEDSIWTDGWHYQGNRLFEDLCSGSGSEAAYWTFRLGAELVIQAYILEVYSVLASRSGNSQRPKAVELAANLTGLLEHLEESAAAGLEGLTPTIVTALLGQAPKPIYARGKSRNGRSHFIPYDTGLWADKVMALFGWQGEGVGEEEEGEGEGSKRRGWHNLPFRLLTRRLYDTVKQELGPQYAMRFIAVMRDTVPYFLRIVPQYDIDHLSVMAKASKHNGLERQASLASLSALARTNWICPQLPDEAGLRMTHWKLIRDPAKELKGVEAAYSRRLKILYRGQQLEVYSDVKSKGPWDPIPSHLEMFGIRTSMTLAAEFQARVDSRMEDDRSSDDSSSSEEGLLA